MGLFDKFDKEMALHKKREMDRIEKEMTLLGKQLDVLSKNEKDEYHKQTYRLFGEDPEIEILEKYLLLLCKVTHKEAPFHKYLKYNWEELIKEGKTPFRNSTYPLGQKQIIKIIKS